MSSVNFYPNAPPLKEEVMEIENQLQKSELDGFVVLLHQMSGRLFIGQNLEYGQFRLFLKGLPDTVLVQQGKKAKGCKKSKQRFTFGFFVCAANKKIDKPIFFLEEQNFSVLEELKAHCKTRICSLFCQFKIMDNLRSFSGCVILP